ncbi:hypothetical protein [Sinorhizobium meliloti]|uniref:hypothetical protein n=1 Tax=Rhizobium meliloti TaxID=382 RepID=UPI000FDB9ECF|nr:hypothetical protein [Sinorhizobium meliloti]RVK37622.1 hypothetical protein CN163_15940 [Sinorhizobium meliloti]
MATSRIPLSALIRDPFVRAAFQRAERDNGDSVFLDGPQQPVLRDGAGFDIGSLKTRESIETHIDRMIALLDSYDGDADLEPELGWTRHACGCCAREPSDDREGVDEREWDQAEDGIADLDGLAEQAPFYYFNAHVL